MILFMGAMTVMLGGFLLYQKRQSAAMLGESVRADSAAAALPDYLRRPAVQAPQYIAAMAPANPLANSRVRGFRNNNPGNLRDYGFPWQGRIGDDPEGFLIFDTADNGIRAMARDLSTGFTRDGENTIRIIVNEWAPSNENNTANYISHVAKLTGFAPDQVLFLNVPTIGALVSAIITHENGSNPYSPQQILNAVIAAGVQ